MKNRTDSLQRELDDLRARIVALENSMEGGPAPGLGKMVFTARRCKLRRLRKHAARIEMALSQANY